MGRRVRPHSIDFEENRSGHNTYHPQLPDFDLITAQNTAANTGINPSARIVRRRSQDPFNYHMNDFANRADLNTLIHLELAQSFGTRNEHQNREHEYAREPTPYAQSSGHYQPDRQYPPLNRKHGSRQVQQDMEYQPALHPQRSLQTEPEMQYKPSIQQKPPTVHFQRPLQQSLQHHRPHTQRLNSTQYNAAVPRQILTPNPQPLSYQVPVSQHVTIPQPIHLPQQIPIPMPIPIQHQVTYQHQYQIPIQSPPFMPYHGDIHHHPHTQQFTPHPALSSSRGNSTPPLSSERREAYNSAVSRSYAKQRDAKRWSGMQVV